jgi:hypothetical protein
VTEAEIIRTHAALRKLAFADAVGTHGPKILEELRHHAPAVGGALLGGLLAPEGYGAEGAAAGAAGGIIGKATGKPWQGALIGPSAYAVYHHLTQPDEGPGGFHGQQPF